MKACNTAGLSILAGGLAFVGSANAVDLVLNGSFEEPPGSGWIGSFGTYNYSLAYFLGPAIPPTENPGANYSWRHGRSDTDFSGPLFQDVDLLSAVSASDIDSGRGIYTFSSWLASYSANPERPYVTVQFLDGTMAAVGGPVVFDRTSNLNFVRFADGATTFDRTTHEHHWAKYLKTGSVPPGARSARVAVTRSPNAGVSGRPDTYTDLVKLDVEAVAFVPPSVSSAQPTGPNVRPDTTISVELQDGTTQINTNSIQFAFDGTTVHPTIDQVGSTTTLRYDPPGLLPPLSSHTYRVIFSDNGPVPTSQTNQFSFSVFSYYDILLPAPIHFENFDGTPEGGLPAGWTALSYSAVPDPTCDPAAPDAGGLQDLNSACYANWVVVNSARFSLPMLTYNSHTPETDYQRVLSTNFANVVNGAIVENLGQGNIAFGDAGYRDGGSQIVYLFSPDFDLSAHNNVYLAFHSLWEQNQDSIGAVEYSVDEGATWLPIVYMIDGPDILFDGAGNVDAAGTLSAVRIGGFEGQATYTDPIDMQLKGGYYGAFIGVESNRWSQLAPFISRRLDDDPVESKRVEVFRLPSADNQPKVRLRFAHAGTDSWYFGIDNVGLYSLSSVSPPVIDGPAPANLTEAVGNNASFSVSLRGIGPFTYQWQHRVGATTTALPGQTNAILALTNLQSANAGQYSVVIGYVGGGSVTSSPASLVVFTPEPARVIGQWDFDSFDLAATCGRNLEYGNSDVLIDTGFSDSDFYSLPRIEGQVVNVMSFPGTLSTAQPSPGYKMFHGLSGTGGGSNVNQYTLIMDILYPSAANNQRRSLLQTDPLNASDGEFRINELNRLGFSGNYHGELLPDQWYRIALAVDLAGPGPNPVVAKFINGVKVGQNVLPEGRDSHWSLSADPAAAWALLFGDDNTDLQRGYVSSIQLRSGRLSDAKIAALGGPQATKIPGAICVSLSGGNVVIGWSGSVLESATDARGPWGTVTGASKPYQVPSPLGTQRFFRSR